MGRMKTVYKYPFNIEDNFSLSMPEGAMIIYAECQHGVPCLWAFVDTLKRTVERKFRLAGTGHPIIENIEHIGSFKMFDGDLIWHLFEVHE